MQAAMPDHTGSTQSDSQLAAATSRDTAAFTDLYRRHVVRVYRYLLYRVGNVEDAQDLTTQTFMTALESIKRYRNDGPFIAWLLGIARHKAIDFQRQRTETIPLDGVAQMPDHAPLPDELAASSIRQDDVIRACRTLAPERAEAISLRFFGGLSNKEVAQVMGKNETAVKMLVHRGVRDLRVRLAASAAADGEIAGGELEIAG